MRNMWDGLEKLRDSQRKQWEKAPPVIRFGEVPWELNKYGKLKWYIHPLIKQTGDRSMMIYILEIPPGSRSGKIKHQGGKAFYIWKGKGYTIINDEKCEWEEEDVLLLPIVPEVGITYQHFNTDLENPALLVGAQPNVFSMVGVDLGVGLEVLETCPEYKVIKRIKKERG